MMKNRINTGLLVAWLTIMSFSLYAQGPGPGRGMGSERHEKLKSAKVAMITERLDLSAEEAQEFWPVYNEHEEERRNLRREMMMMRRDTDLALLNDTEAQEALNKLMEARKKEAEIDAAFLEEISRMMGPRRTLMLVKTEMEFNRMVIRRLRSEKGKKERGGRFR